MASRKRELAAAAVVAAIGIAAAVQGAKSFERDRIQAAALASIRQQLFDEAQPVHVANCEFARFGDANDGGYVVCGNLLEGAQSAYSYGIAGTDNFGCEISRTLKIPVHEYDCFDLRQPSCPDGRLVFHPECVGPERATQDARAFDSIAGQIARNGDAGKPLVMKVDVEGAEWDSFLAVPDETFERVAQLVVEFHHVEEEKYVRTFKRLKEHFVVAHVHYNNYSCRRDLAPFPAWAFEVLLVNTRIARTDGTPGAPGPATLDAPNDPTRPDCQRVP